MGEKTGVIVGDSQGDFTEWRAGSLAVPDSGGNFIKRVGEVTAILHASGLPIFGVQDWHPGDHISFYTSHHGKKPFETIEIDGRHQVLWSPHCVQGTENARILVNNLFLAVVQKGRDRQYDSYSAFQDDREGAQDGDGVHSEAQWDRKGCALRHRHRLLCKGHRWAHCRRAFQVIVIE